MSGVDRHPNKRDATTGTAPTTPSEAVYDARWTNRGGSSSTVPSTGSAVAVRDAA